MEEQDIREMCMSMSCQSGGAPWAAGCLPMCADEVPKNEKGFEIADCLLYVLTTITHQLTQTKWPSTENHDSLSASWSPKWGLYCLFPLFSFTRSSLGTGKQGVQGRSYKRVTTPRTTKIDSPMSASNPLCDWQMVSNQHSVVAVGSRKSGRRMFVTWHYFAS